MFKRITIAAVVLFVSACQSTSMYQNSSVVDYLYPKSENQSVSIEIPRLTLPLRVGIAFTPGGFSSAAGLTEVKKTELMSNLSAHFKDLDFVKSIDIIPSDYLRQAGSFENLDQLKRMFNIDVIALVSFDQTKFTDEGLASLAYWTIVGAYVVPGEKNSTHTMLDTVLYDIDSRKMLFRAPGTSSVKSTSTLVNLREQTRIDSIKGFDRAGASLAENLKVQLDLFKTKVAESPEAYQIATSEGYQGSGSTNLLFALLASLALVRKLKK